VSLGNEEEEEGDDDDDDDDDDDSDDDGDGGDGMNDRASLFTSGGGARHRCCAGPNIGYIHQVATWLL
jgi:hypothetical protein